MDILYVVLDVLGILGIVCLGAFIIVLIADLILSSMDGHEGVFFHKNKKNKKNAQTDGVVEPLITSEPVTPVKSEPTITPYYENLTAKELEPIKTENVSSVDFDKAAEEQKIIKQRGRIEQVEPQIKETIFEDVNPEADENELTNAIAEISRVALDEIALESELKKQQEELSIIKRQEEIAKQLEKERVEREKLEAERLEKERIEQIRIEKIETERLEKERIEQAKLAKKKDLENAKALAEEKNVEDLKKLRDDIFSLRRSAFKDLQEVKSNDIENEIELSKREYDKQIKAKLKELEELKLTTQAFDVERNELLRYKKEALNKDSELEKVALEKEQLERVVQELKNKTEVETKPYYTKEYYANRLSGLEEELAEVEKDLKYNKREFIPLERIKRSYERDQEKLRRKEAIVAKQKVAIYGVNSSANIDPKRKEKLDEEVKILSQLKESVFQCDQVLKQNKDRYPVLEKSNKLLTKTYNRLIGEVENVKAALTWYEENENK